MKMILASNSPRRKELLRLTNLDFEVIPADVDETPLEGESPPDYVLRLAASKARAVCDQQGGDSLVIAADTTVADGREILGKPVDSEDAARILRQLQGRTHQVFTAIAIAQNGKLITELCGSEVPMREYSEDEVQAYIATGDPMDKAGAYAIQHAGFHPVENFNGCFANVMGFPLCHLTRSILQFGVSPPPNLPDICQKAIQYSCSVYDQILREQL